jgi:hypothetical protein
VNPKLIRLATPLLEAKTKAKAAGQPDTETANFRVVKAAMELGIALETCQEMRGRSDFYESKGISPSMLSEVSARIHDVRRELSFMVGNLRNKRLRADNAEAVALKIDQITWILDGKSPCAWCGKAPAREGKGTCSEHCSEDWNLHSI